MLGMTFSTIYNCYIVATSFIA